MAQQRQQQGALAIRPDAISIALAHPALSTEIRVLCAAAQACKAWREAVQQCRACNTAVAVRLDAPLSRLCSFTQWLPKHAMLVHSITISLPQYFQKVPNNVDGLPWRLHLQAAYQLLQLALQLTTALPAAAAAAAAAPPPPPAGASWQNTAAVHQPQQLLLQQQQQQQQQQQPVRLPSISSVTMAGTAGMLAALPAHSLTKLSITELEQPYDSAAVSAALARLSNLQALQVDDRRAVASKCLGDVSQLKQLTMLELDCCTAQDSVMQQLVAQHLPLRVLRIDDYSWSARLDVSHWTQLLEYSATCGREGLNITLPSQLQKLEMGDVYDEESFKAVLQLQQLRYLALRDRVMEPQLLLRLAQLPALQQLSLHHFLSFNDDEVPSIAAAWPQLPQLRSLTICFTHQSFSDQLPSRQQWQAICSGLAACTGLTELGLDEVAVRSEEQGDEDQIEPVQLCAKVTGLTNLKDLHLNMNSSLVPGDALALTALTGLTHLRVFGAGAGVGDLAATAIASSCRQLQHLDLRNCDLSSMACLAMVRHLTQLTALNLEGNSGLARQGLMLLTGLTRLQQLEVNTSSEVTDEVVQSFWIAVRQQQQQ